MKKGFTTTDEKIPHPPNLHNPNLPLQYRDTTFTDGSVEVWGAFCLWELTEKIVHLAGAIPDVYFDGGCAMKLFRKSFSVCVECGVYFEPHSDCNPNFKDFCKTHREPKLELLRRKLKVISWATANWEKLEPEALKEEIETQKSYSEAIGQSLSNIHGMSGHQGGMLGGLGHPFGR